MLPEVEEGTAAGRAGLEMFGLLRVAPGFAGPEGTEPAPDGCVQPVMERVGSDETAVEFAALPAFDLAGSAKPALGEETGVGLAVVLRAPEASAREVAGVETHSSEVIGAEPSEQEEAGVAQCGPVLADLAEPVGLAASGQIPAVVLQVSVAPMELGS